MFLIWVLKLHQVYSEAHIEVCASDKEKKERTMNTKIHSEAKSLRV